MPNDFGKNKINHILLVYRRSIIDFLGEEKFISTLLDIVTYLYNIKVGIVSLFESTGLVYTILKNNLSQKLITLGFKVHSIDDNSVTFSKTPQLLTAKQSTEVLETPEVFICKTNYLHSSSAHLELLALCNTLHFKNDTSNNKTAGKKCTKKCKKNAKNVIKGTNKLLKQIKYKTPPLKAVLQPCIAKKLSISTPDVLICMHLNLKQILFTLNVSLERRLDCLKSYFANATAPSKRYIYPFGPSGVPPWALSQAEIYQVFGTSINVIEECIQLFKHCNRRNGR